jgi:hypothetical protein
MTQQTKRRPRGVTMRALMAGRAGVVSVIHALQGLGLLPYSIACL